MEASDFFIEVPVDTDSQTLADDAVERLSERWPAWEPNDADLEVIQIETLAPMAENVAQALALVPRAIFREYGTKLVGRPYNAGVSAGSTLTFFFIDSSGYTIPQGFEVDIDGFAFTVDVEQVVPVGSSSIGGVQVHASVEGEDANGLVGSNIVPMTGLAGIDHIVLDAPTSGGEESEDDVDYQNNLSVDLKLQAKTLVTTRDFEIWAMQKAGIGRAVADHAGDRAVNVAVATVEGELVSAGDKTALTADFDQFKLVNTVLTLLDPTYTTINVTYTVKAVPGFDFTDLQARIDSMLTQLLSPPNWGVPKGQSVLQSWVNEPVVRQNTIIDRIGDIDGVNYVTSVAITGSAGSASGTNWTMAGTYPLPRPGAMVGTIT